MRIVIQTRRFLLTVGLPEHPHERLQGADTADAKLAQNATCSPLAWRAAP
ncbi:MAG: hypothetical protein KJ614_00755 [Gammaproteobacteria bacterium]|nr:hypothetical protein [Rhodoferax sp.]MBU3897452.1 hypothetical protein [Gammaproteobacteria bacterium]MBU3998499.1 hypothetical protein [Gammaproteobacteria bacterium]MBU4018798.1 hypothetical protein [Gammaproteobacteria bacterium]MBU4079753.1 hypothetical protein [Gammaproteobacteria bacterium]MBU4113149.1 hypothetical protein [Gammaproteobacteria bacterium]